MTRSDNGRSPDKVLGHQAEWTDSSYLEDLWPI
jgi:hypothetical protein